MLLVDTSVVVKWFRDEGESEVESSRALLSAHRRGDVQVVVLDLCCYELGNVLTRSLKEPAVLVKETLALLLHVCGPVVRPAPSWYATAADLAVRHQLSFYDGAWAAAAQALGCPLVTADHALLAGGLGIGPAAAADTLPT